MMKNMIHIIMGLFVTTVFGLAGCGGGGGSSNDTAMATTNKVVSTVTVVDGNNQTATVGTELPRALVALIKNSEGQAIAGQTVNFKVTSGGGTVFAGAATSDAGGYARERWTMGTTVGTQKVEVRAVDSSGAAVVFASFDAIATAGTAQTISVLSGDNQTAQQLQTLPQPLKVIVKDAYGNSVPGASVTFIVNTGGGSVLPGTVVTDALGTASTIWTLGLGGAVLTVSSNGVTQITVNASATQLPPSTPTLISIVSGDSQTVVQHSLLLNPLVVLVTDEHRNGVPNIPVTFSAASGSGYVNPLTVIRDNVSYDYAYGFLETVTTDSVGRASWKGYFNTAGQQNINASVTDVSAITFNSTVTASSYTYDGVYLCTRDQLLQYLEFANGALIDHSAYGGSGSINESTGSFTVSFKYKFGDSANITGQLVAYSLLQATGSGTYTHFNQGVAEYTSNVTCARQ